MTDLNTTLPLPSTLAVGLEYEYKSSSFPDDIGPTPSYWEISPTLLFFLMLFFPMIWIFGLLGNGVIIWSLGFIIQRNPITTYVLNLAVSDLGVLVGFVLTLSFTVLEEEMSFSPKLPHLFYQMFSLTQALSLHLLTAISVERCASVLFPIWYRCRRPRHQSAIVCASLWTMYVLLNFVNIFVLKDDIMENDTFSEKDILFIIVYAINFLFCTPLMIICSITLFIRVCCSLHRRRHRKLSAALLLAIFIFILFCVPLNALITIEAFHRTGSNYLWILGLAFTTINSSINPLIYFVFGRKKSWQFRKNLTVALKDVFSDKTDSREDGNHQDFEMQ